MSFSYSLRGGLYPLLTITPARPALLISRAGLQGHLNEGKEGREHKPGNCVTDRLSKNWNW